MVKPSNIFVALATAALALAGNASAQPYPDRMIEVVIPAPPGGIADVIGRVLMEGMAPHLGQRLIAVNRPGGAGSIGTAAAARAKADGYTLFHAAANNLTVLPFTEVQAPFTRKSFDGICQTFKNDQVIVARPNTYKTVTDLIAATRAKPGGLSYGTVGLFSIPHLVMVELSQLVKAEFNHVPFRGPAEPIQMTVSGEIDFAASPLSAAIGSNLAMPALFAQRRHPALPDVPTVIEQGFDIAPLSIGGLFVPAGTPADIKRKLEDACTAAMQTEAFVRLAKNNLQPSDFSAGSAVFSANLDKDVEAKRRLLASLGMVKN